MKTAKELKDQALNRTITRTPFIKGDLMFHYDEFQTFCEQLCKEQREICSRELQEAIEFNKDFRKSLSFNLLFTRTVNAPMPEL